MGNKQLLAYIDEVRARVEKGEEGSFIGGYFPYSSIDGMQFYPTNEKRPVVFYTGPFKSFYSAIQLLVRAYAEDMVPTMLEGLKDKGSYKRTIDMVIRSAIMGYYVVTSEIETQLESDLLWDKNYHKLYERLSNNSDMYKDDAGVIVNDIDHKHQDDWHEFWEQSYNISQRVEKSLGG